MIKRLLSCVREYKKPTVLTLIFITLEAVIEVFIPFITADLVNSVEKGAQMTEILWRGGLLVLLACASLACGGIAARTCAKASAGFSRNLRGDIFRKIQSYSFENIDKFSTPSLVTRVTTDVANVQMSFMMIIRTAIRSPLMLIFSITMATVMGGALALTFVVVVPLLAFGLIFVARKAMPAFRRVFKKYDKLNESIEENVRGMRVVKGFSREEHERRKFDGAAKEIRKEFEYAERIVAWNRPIMQFCVYFNMIFILLVGSNIIVTTGGESLGVGEISAMLTYAMQILMSLMMLSMIYVILLMSFESMKRVDELLTEEPAMKEAETPVLDVPDGSIDFENVSFKYSKSAEKHALTPTTLHIASGMTVGVIGGTGSGKSTFVQLIPRLYDVTEGTVKVGGIDVRDYAIPTLRNAVAMVLQKNLLFSGTIAENLRWGNENATDEELREAATLAAADGFIDAFPDGYNTHIEQGGTNVSGGQRQRLCIARALLKRPKILILDDSTSAVDTATDARIRAAFRAYIPETTKIIIAQRISSVQDADLILVLDNGSVVAAGTHDELLSTSPIYAEVYEQQTKGGESDEE